MNEIGATVLTFVIVFLACYLIGSISYASFMAHHYGIDIHKVGSKNAGGTNVGRSVGKKQGITVMVLDIFKCYLPCLAVKLICTYAPISFVPYKNIVEILVGVAAVAVCLGHAFPIYNGFKGGKCVACIAGYILLSSPIIFALAISLFLLILKKSKRLSLGSIFGLPSAALFSIVPAVLDLTVLPDVLSWNGGSYFGPACVFHLTFITTAFLLALSLLSLFLHRKNIVRLIHHEEPETHFKHSTVK